MENNFKDGGSVLLAAVESEDNFDDVSGNISNADNYEIYSVDNFGVNKHEAPEDDPPAVIVLQQQETTQGDGTPTAAPAVNPARANPSSSDDSPTDEDE